MDLKVISEIAAKEMKTKASHPFKEPGNKFYHGQRTAEIVKQLCNIIGYKENPEILTIAAWFHDICNGEEDHEKKAPTKLFYFYRTFVQNQSSVIFTELFAYMMTAQKLILKLMK